MLITIEQLRTHLDDKQLLGSEGGEVRFRVLIEAISILALVKNGFRDWER